ncbi:MAG: glutamine--fructose-6-phosphate transaminase (isomerizing) [Oscillospiraceae bacterium]|nr:glutamine--fructose-6-phosphate transaminase (isomerizing) [Oscillospiraceae bacterium]
MCGIVGFTGTRDASEVLLDGLARLEYRGYDSAGIAVMTKGGIELEKVSGKVSRLRERVNLSEKVRGESGIGHTRWATHGAPTDTNAHPHLSNDGRFAVVHNGIIENYASLRKELMAKGFTFLSETDTEVIVHLLEYYDKGNVKNAVMKTVSRLEGSYALGVICTDTPGMLYAVKEASPLILGVGAGESFFASDVTALVAYTKNAIYLDDGEFAELTPESITVFDRAGRKIEKSVTPVTWDIEAAEKGGYEHFMLKEIMEQPAAVRAAIEPRLRDGEVTIPELTLTDEELAGINKITITACGSAYYAGCAAKYALQALTGLPVETALASELRYSEPIIDTHTLLIAISQSGETADTIAAIKECKGRDARVLAIVNVVGSTIAKIADMTMYTYAGPEIAVATTKGYTTQLAALFMLAVAIGKRLGRADGEKCAALTGEIARLPRLIQNAIDMNHRIKALAKKYAASKSLFFIGRNTDWASALEGALKMKEISYIHAESYAAGELKHGTIALIEEGTPVIAVSCNERLFDKTASNIIEVKARGAKVLAIAVAGNRKIVSQADDVIYIPAVNTLFTPILAVIPMQLLAYYVAKENGCDIDKPKNLAKSVTVE